MWGIYTKKGKKEIDRCLSENSAIDKVEEWKKKYGVDCFAEYLTDDGSLADIGNNNI